MAAEETSPLPSAARAAGVPEAIGFAPPLLGPRPVRLAVIGSAPGVVLVEKPAGLLPWQHSWFPDQPSLLGALEVELARGKPELARLGMTGAGPVLAAEPEASGAALLALDPTALADWRNALGSERIRQTFWVVARDRKPALGDERRASDPLATDLLQARLHRGGKGAKKATTVFRRIDDSPSTAWQLWEAEAGLCRWHQVRLHAHAIGLEVLGETLYAKVEPPTVGKLRKRFKGDADRPVFTGLGLHLRRVRGGPAGRDPIDATVPLPRSWDFAMKVIGIELPKSLAE